MPIYIDRDDDTTPDLKGVKLADGTKYEFNYDTLKNKPCFKKDGPVETYLDQVVIPGVHFNSYLTFSSEAPFTLGIDVDYDWKGKGWDGTLEYSTDARNWVALWEGDGPFNPISSNANNNLYIRGSNNTSFASSYCTVFTITSTEGVECHGNIETLLDYQTVENGNHPVMGEKCFQSLFDHCTALTIPPELPATTLSEGCYLSMFGNCTSLMILPTLPATTLAVNCYANMFYGCTSLVTVPQLPATTLVDSCYADMFGSCSSIRLSETQTGMYTVPYRIPSSGSGVDADYALSHMFSGTGGTFTGTPTINTTYYLSTAQ